MERITARMDGVLLACVSGRLVSGNAAGFAEAAATGDDDRTVILDRCPVSAARAFMP